MRALRPLLSYLLLASVATVLLFPLLYALAGSLMSPRELAEYPPAFIPAHPGLDSFAAVQRVIPLGRQYFNSVLVAGIVTIAQVITGVLSAYAFSFLRFPLRGLCFALFLATLFVPYEAVIIPNYLTMANAGLIDTYAALTLPFLAGGFGTFLLRQFFLSFPKDLYEAAIVDGTGHLRFLWSILVPLSRPAIASLAIFQFIATWNHYFWPLLVTRSAGMQTLQIGISQLQNADAQEENVVLAGVVLALIPTLILTFAAQRHIVRGLTAGAVRG